MSILEINKSIINKTKTLMVMIYMIIKYRTKVNTLDVYTPKHTAIHVSLQVDGFIGRWNCLQQVGIMRDFVTFSIADLKKKKKKTF